MDSFAWHPEVALLAHEIALALKQLDDVTASVEQRMAHLIAAVESHGRVRRHLAPLRLGHEEIAAINARLRLLWDRIEHVSRELAAQTNRAT